MTQRGKILIVTLDDGTATREVTVYAELADEFKSYFKEDAFLVVNGKVSEDRFSGGLRVTAERVMDLASARIQFALGLRLHLHAGAQTDIKQLKALLSAHLDPNGCPVLIQYQTPTASAELSCSDAWRVYPDEDLQQKLVELLTPESVEIAYV